ncbi:hypothetical protein BGP78_03330 [Pseudoalteromonas sp. MSK9-3]|uniref:glycoside hydrolase family 25 protein n=1 Tax=Pseudoalteromonas sp. MSK9-3 TaxID=1897633 RepID=UPI000ED67ADC|nr:GH25 family lysozyme [Pseudoalteromonas sp. MSK9-3]RJE73306.1 hypothetical protein BGP78_03330 [Pseudoalteromonas sp. MSK9-3]
MSIRILQGLGVLALLLFLLNRPTVFSPLGTYSTVTPLENKAVGTDKILGVDVSHQQGEIDWQQVAKAGVSFAYLKATDGITYQDPAFLTYATSIARTTMLVGAYHFFEAEDDPIAQAENFIKHVKSVNMSLTPMVDVEVTKGQTPQTIASRLQVFLQYINASLGCKPIIYSSRNFWSADIGPAFNSYSFWLAEYNPELTLPKDIKNVVMWQYSDKGQIAGVSQAVDLDKAINAPQGLELLKCKY